MEVERQAIIIDAEVQSKELIAVKDEMQQSHPVMMFTKQEKSEYSEESYYEENEEVKVESTVQLSEKKADTEMSSVMDLEESHPNKNRQQYKKRLA